MQVIRAISFAPIVSSSPGSPTAKSAMLRKSRLSHVLRGVVLVLVLFLLAPCAATQSPSGEYQLKAAFVFHFAQMVEWPSDFLAPNSPLIFCTLEEDSFSAAVDWAVDGKQIGNHAVQTRHPRDTNALRGCHLLILVAKDKKRVALALAAVKDAPVLTIGDSDNFTAEGGIMGLLLQDNKIRFDINLFAAQSANLKISSRLLLLARNVIGGSQTGMSR
jgi:hypothetical protein